MTRKEIEMGGSAVRIYGTDGAGPDDYNIIANNAFENRGYYGAATERALATRNTKHRIGALTFLSLGLAVAVALSTSRAFAATPSFSHVFIVVEENHSYSQVVGNPSMPYLNMLINNYGLATQYFANGHPSLPNYLWLTSGSNDGITTDVCPATVTQDNIVRHLAAAGVSRKAYMEDLKAVGSLTCGGINGGKYAGRHDPFIYFTDVQNSPTDCCKHRSVHAVRD
jgi:phospholipase C